MKILVVTSTFPRWSGDTDPTFVYELSSRLVDCDAEVHVLAPHTKGALRSEIVDDLNLGKNFLTSTFYKLLVIVHERVL